MARRARTDIQRQSVEIDGQPVLSRVTARAEYFEGVLPHPETLAAYEALHPGITGWMVERVTFQQDHRMAIEKEAVAAKAALASRGQIFAFLLGLGCLIIAGFGFYCKQPLAGFGAVVVGIGTIGGAYVYGSKNEADERARRDEILHPRPPQPEPQQRPPKKPNRGGRA